MVEEGGRAKPTVCGMGRQEVGVQLFKSRQEQIMLRREQVQVVEVELRAVRGVFSQEATAHLRETMVEDGAELKRQEDREVLQHPFLAALEL